MGIASFEARVFDAVRRVDAHSGRPLGRVPIDLVTDAVVRQLGVRDPTPESLGVVTDDEILDAVERIAARN